MEGESRTKPHEPPIRQEVGDHREMLHCGVFDFLQHRKHHFSSMLYVPKWFYVARFLQAAKVGKVANRHLRVLQLCENLPHRAKLPSTEDGRK